MQYSVLIFRLALALNEHGLKMPILTTHFSAQNFLSFNILSNVTTAYFVFCMTQILTISLKWLHVFIQ